MVRPREFDEETAIEGAMRIFWRQGYKATNLPDLLQAMNITRGSFYKAFRDKETVYLRALDLYDRKVVTGTIAAINACDADAAPSDCLKRLFEPPPDPKAGCFICNAMVEVAADNDAVADQTTKMVQRLTSAIRSVIQARSSCTDPAQLDSAADLVMHLYFGFQAMGKASSRQSDWPARLDKILPGAA